ncbi:hypothetical protein DFH06DRAFT_529246 [Mycena polygramma]|nr:hypothetical protein DFH06DRAFT_529246 [Mycena polygramma]
MGSRNGTRDRVLLSPTSISVNRLLHLPLAMAYYSLTLQTNVSDVSKEVKCTIARFCSPLDLVQFSRLDRECRDIVMSERLFERSMAELGAPTLDSNFLSPTLIVFIFTESRCWACGKGTDSYPLSFSLRIRVCNEQCKQNLYGEPPGCGREFATIPPPADRRGDDALLEYIEPWAPYLETSAKGKKIYSSYQLASALARLSEALEADKVEDSRPASQSNKSLLLQEWSHRAAELPALMQVSILRLVSLIKPTAWFSRAPIACWHGVPVTRRRREGARH